ncbi:MAG TPA: AbrB/MazE/SpoVT family DNA-binding domain-containing protein [Candidatus Paceibacterota bacterium]|nr:AbrB/MazE/SpoVT family DNA-binding domain-containing protein [Candidatus Paceibacterota bacterium]
MWTKKVFKVGDSIAVTLPVEICRTFNIKRGDYLVVTIGKDHEIQLIKFDPNKRPDLLDFEEREVPIINFTN